MGEDTDGDTGGDSIGGGGGTWDDDHSNTLWGWLGSVVSGLKSVWESISTLPQLIADKIITGIKNIFIPDAQTVENEFYGFLEELKLKFNFNTDFFESLLTDGTPVTDVNADYEIPNVGTFNLKFFDSYFLVQGVGYFRPFIRGFIILLLGLYNIKMILGFIRQDAGIVTGKAVDMELKARNKE